MRFIHLYLIGYFRRSSTRRRPGPLAGRRPRTRRRRLDRHRAAHRRRPGHHAGRHLRTPDHHPRLDARLRHARSCSALSRRSAVPDRIRPLSALARVVVHAQRMRRRLRLRPRCSCVAGRGACKEEGTITVHSSRSRASRRSTKRGCKAALATRESSKLPWGKKTLLRPLAVRRRPQADRGVLRRPRVSRRAGHRLRRQAERQAGRRRRHADHRRRRAGQGRGGRLRRLRRHSRRRISND